MNHGHQNYWHASNGNNSRLMAKRAPSTAEEFHRVAEEKTREAKERMASQNVKSYMMVHKRVLLVTLRLSRTSTKHEPWGRLPLEG
ncbi:hypothetical protein SESBI_22362 [Sesbania bispinosa]|nr:hypothetical protein SESBI_22362 [Sesbania bispinosa]